MNDNTKLSELDKIKMARHCIGMDRRKTYHRRGKEFFRPYRNYYSTFWKEPNWESLVESGFAERGYTPLGNVIYHMTRKGLDWLGERLSVTIHDEEN